MVWDGRPRGAELDLGVSVVGEGRVPMRVEVIV